MKYIITCFLFIANTYLSSFSQVNSNLTKNNLKGKIMLLTEWTYSVKQIKEGEKKDLKLKRTATYNSDGNINEDAFFKPDSSLDWKYSNKYDQSGYRIESTMYNS